MGHLLGYARVSTTSTPSSRSTPSRTPAAIGGSPRPPAAPRDRPTLAQLPDQLRPGDPLVGWKLDRLGRSLRQLVDTVTGLAGRGIGFRSLQEAIDTTTPAASWCSTCSRPWPSSNVTWSANAPPPGWPPPAPGVAMAADRRS